MNEFSTSQIKELETTVIEIVKNAADLVKSTKFDITKKGGSANIVTSSDIKVQRFLHEKLSKLIENSGFFCEEEDLRDLDNKYIWVIDPIDGTMNYARGIPECAISVALVCEKKAVLGVVYNIWRDDLFSATVGGGAYLNGQPISVSDNSFKDGILCTAMSVYKKEYAKVCGDVIFEAYMQCNDVRRFGTCALELCYLAAGMCDLYFEIRVFPWDYAAGYLILQEAGGTLRGLDKEELTFDKTTALIGANNYENYLKLDEIVSKHIKELPYEE